jgi:F0F1-type ATP synthase membrane subunit b/b'
LQRNRDPRVAALARAALAPGLAFAAGDAAASEGGLELFPDWRFQLPLLVAFFAALVPVVDRLLLRPLLQVLEARAERTDGARKRAGRLEEQARELVARYEGSIADARRSAEAARRELLEQVRRRVAEQIAAARVDAEQEMGRVRREVGSALAEARVALRAQSAELAREAVARVLGRSVA